MQCTYIGWIIPTLGRTYMQKNRYWRKSQKFYDFFLHLSTFNPPIPSQPTSPRHSVPSTRSCSVALGSFLDTTSRTVRNWPDHLFDTACQFLDVSRYFRQIASNCNQIWMIVIWFWGPVWIQRAWPPAPFFDFQFHVPCCDLQCWDWRRPNTDSAWDPWLLIF